MHRTQNMTFDGCLHTIENTDASTDKTAYADDLVPGKPNKDPIALVKQIQKVIDRVVEWGHTCGLTFSTEKSVAIMFHRTAQTPLNLQQLHINGTPIPYSTEIKYLGVTLTQNLS